MEPLFVLALIPHISLFVFAQNFALVYGGSCVIFKSMIEIGFLDILQGSASLTQMLSSSAWHMKNGGTEDHESSIDYARYSLMATRALRRRLDDPAQRASLETIIAILTFAAFAVCVDVISKSCMMLFSRANSVAESN